MDKEQAIDLLDNLIGMIEDNQDNDYDTALRMAIEALKAQLSQEGTTSDLISRQAAIDALDKRFDNIPMEQTAEILKLRKDLRELPTIQPVATDTNVGDKISKFIDGLEETFAYIREREGGDSICGLCEYDGAYIGESGDWCNECPGFNRDDCFKLSDETRKKWTDEIIKALPTARSEPQWIPVGEKLPETEDFVLASLSGKYRNTTFEHACEIADYADGEWCIYAYPNMSAEKCAELIEAWMPLPTPCQKGATP